MQKSMMKGQNKAQKKAQKAPKAAKVNKVAKRKVATKVTKKAVTPVMATTAAAPKAMMSTTVAATTPKATKLTTASLPKQMTDFGLAPLPGLAPAARLNRNRIQSSTAFKKSLKAFDAQEGAVELSPEKVIYQAQKQVQIDINTLTKELDTGLMERDLAQRNITYTVNDEGIITLMQKKMGYNVEFTFDREFEFVEDQQDEEKEEGDEGDEGKWAFHNITITLSKPSWGSLRLGGQLHLNSDLKIHTFTPYQDGVELRTISTEDLSDAAVNSLFDALEVICVSDQDCGAIIEVARQQRLKSHLESLNFLNSFFGSEQH